jgi:hypothetical protein
MIYIDCFYYIFVIDEKKLKKYNFNKNLLSLNNNTINYYNNFNYIEQKKLHKSLLKSYKSIDNNLYKLSKINIS